MLLELALAQHEAGHSNLALASQQKTSINQRALRRPLFRLFTTHRRGQAAPTCREPFRGNPRARASLTTANPEYARFLINTLLGSGQLTGALAEAIQAQRWFPDDPQIQFLFGLASYYVTQGDLTRVARRNLAEAQPDSPQTMLLSGMVYRQQGQKEEATRVFLCAARGGVTDAHLLLGLIYKDAGNISAAEGELREAERLNPQDGQVEMELGQDPAQARRCCPSFEAL